MSDTTPHDGSQARPLHTPEPWPENRNQGNDKYISRADYSRARACVNAFAGVQDPAAEIAQLKQNHAAIQALRQKLDTFPVCKEDALMVMLDTQDAEIAALRANQKTLVDALKSILKDDRDMVTMEVRPWHTTSYRARCCNKASEALNKIKESENEV